LQCVQDVCERGGGTQTVAPPAAARRRGLGLIVVLGFTGLIVDGWTAFGHRPTGARRERMLRRRNGKTATSRTRSRCATTPGAR
jgi:hypothetical protein